MCVCSGVCALVCVCWHYVCMCLWFSWGLGGGLGVGVGWGYCPSMSVCSSVTVVFFLIFFQIKALLIPEKDQSWFWTPIRNLLIHLLIFTMQIFPPTWKITIPKYNAVSYSQTTEKLFSAAVKNNFNMPGIDKLYMCVCYIRETINLPNCHIWLISNKYVYKHIFSVSYVLKQS